jgi:hypothetical protein
MRLWEIGGALLVLLGLFLFFLVYALVVGPEHRIFEGGPLTVIGIVIFRGGIHLLKVGAAARACRDFQERMREPKNTTPRGKTETRLDPAARR